MVDRTGTFVSFYIPSFERGGVERLVINLSRELVHQGVTVDVLVRETDPPIEQLDPAVSIVRLDSLQQVDTAAHRLLPPHVSNAVLSFPAYVQYLRRRTPDLLVSMQTSPFAIAGAEVAQVDTTVVVRESNTPSMATASPGHTIGRLAPLAKRLVYPKADAIVAVSRDAASDVAEYVGVPREQVTTVYNPTYNESILEQSREPVDHEWFQQDIPVIVSVGRFSDQKDFETLIRAFDAVAANREVRLVLIGDGENRASLEAAVASRGLAECVTFLGYQENPHKFVARSSIFVLSSTYEGLPNVLIEAIGVGTPVIATDCPSGPREILLDGEGGTLVPVGDEDSMAAAITRYLDDPEYAHERLRSAREQLDRFTPQRAATEYLRLID